MTTRLLDQIANAVTTSGTTPQVLLTYPIPLSTVVNMTVDVVGYDAPASSACSFKYTWAVRRDGSGGPQAINSASPVTIANERDSVLTLATAVLSISGNNVILTVTGVNGSFGDPVQWYARMHPLLYTP